MICADVKAIVSRRILCADVNITGVWGNGDMGVIPCGGCRFFDLPIVSNCARAGIKSGAIDMTPTLLVAHTNENIAVCGVDRDTSWNIVTSADDAGIDHRFVYRVVADHGCSATVINSRHDQEIAGGGRLTGVKFIS